MSIRIILSMLTFLIWNVLNSQPDINQEVTLQYNNTPANIIFRDIQHQTGNGFAIKGFEIINKLWSIQVIKNLERCVAYFGDLIKHPYFNQGKIYHCKTK
ncbi:MAG: hypothetical protein IPN86_06070 [Saprospiraceae bacterium]|nr:hypothetical protein [Saprospiraceae bacterium]